jgi:hypothetical protein
MHLNLKAQKRHTGVVFAIISWNEETPLDSTFYSISAIFGGICY